MSAPQISVIMPCRNAADTLDLAVESVLTQTCGAFELLVWNDGSTDATGERLAAHAARDARVRVIGSDAVGLVEALRRLADASSGEFIARMDADDLSLPRRFERQLAFMDERPELALCGCLYETIGDPGGLGRARYDAWMNALVTAHSLRREVFVECPIAHPTFFMRRAAFESVGGYQDHGWAEDYDLILRFVAAGFELENVGETLFQWRNHPARTSLVDPRYAETAFRALKRHYLIRIHGEKLHLLYQWGAGDVGKRWLPEWDTVRPKAVVDIHPRKIGKRIHGYTVIPPEQLPGPGEAFTVVLVGARGARDDIRAQLNPRGHREGVNYVFLA